MCDVCVCKWQRRRTKVSSERVEQPRRGNSNAIQERSYPEAGQNNFTAPNYGVFFVHLGVFFVHYGVFFACFNLGSSRALAKNVGNRDCPAGSVFKIVFLHKVLKPRRTIRGASPFRSRTTFFLHTLQTPEARHVRGQLSGVPHAKDTHVSTAVSTTDATVCGQFYPPPRARYLPKVIFHFSCCFVCIYHRRATRPPPLSGEVRKVPRMCQVPTRMSPDNGVLVLARLCCLPMTTKSFWTQRSTARLATTCPPLPLTPQTPHTFISTPTHVHTRTHTLLWSNSARYQCSQTLYKKSRKEMRVRPNPHFASEIYRPVGNLLIRVGHALPRPA